MVDVGDVLGERYEVLEYLGCGGMADVWRANDRLLDRDVALKTPFARLAGATGVQFGLLHQEATAASKLFNHPHVVATLDLINAGGLPGIIMEYLPGVDGRTFARQYLMKRQDRLTRTALALYVVLCAARGLMHAHERNVVHRDVKPSNVQISLMGEVKLCDFGLAKFADEATRALTRKGNLTPLYAAPEQLHGAPASIDTDLYQLGCMLHEMLEGQAAFEDRGTQAAVDHAKLHEPEPDPTNMNGLLASEKVAVLDLYRGLVSPTPKSRWRAYQCVESLAKVLHRPAWEMHFGPGLDARLRDRVLNITRFPPAPIEESVLEYQDPDEALSESIALVLAEVGSKFWLKRRDWVGGFLHALRLKK